MIEQGSSGVPPGAGNIPQALQPVIRRAMTGWRNSLEPRGRDRAVQLEQLNRQQFDRFRHFIYKKSGIRIDDQKVSLLSNRIRRRLKALKIDSFEAYYRFLTSSAAAGELEHFLDAVTTNETFFFRTTNHFDWFRREFVPEVIAEARLGRREQKLRIWSAGCATGAEPFTIAICLTENLYRLRDWSIEVLGTDISEKALNDAREGVFTTRAVESLTDRQRRRYFRAVSDDRWQLRPQIKDLVRFEHHNLIKPVPYAPFDCIFIRNVLIYFDRASKKTVVDHLTQALVPGGYMVVGPSEGVFDMLDPLTRRSAFLYQNV